jgi:hypothetical protein
MKWTATLIGTWVAALALGAFWSGLDASYTTASDQNDPFIFTEL